MKDSRGNTICQGNVLHSSTGKFIIVTKVMTDTLDWIPIDHTNCCGTLRQKITFHTRSCPNCDYMMVQLMTSIPCSVCNGLGTIEVPFAGADQYTIVADTIKDYLLACIKDLFPILK